MKNVTLIVVLSLVSGCVSVTSVGDDIFLTPAEHRNKIVVVCGQMIDSANLIRPSIGEESTEGLVLLNHGPLDPLHRGEVCVRGLLDYVGCLDGEVICTDGAYNYGIRVYEVVNP